MSMNKNSFYPLVFFCVGTPMLFGCAGSPPATEETAVKILFDEDALYIGAWMYDREPSQIIPGERRRDRRLHPGGAARAI